MAIPVALVHIRSQLQYLSQEFNNLTLAELKELKFPLIQKIFMELFIYSPILQNHELCQKCIDLIEKRNKAIKYIKKEERVQYESEYKLQYMSIIQDILICLQYPPACEAFADILNPLMTNTTVVFAAIEFVLSIVLPSSTQLPKNQENSATPAGTKIPPTKQNNNNKSTSKTTISPSSNTEVKDIDHVLDGPIIEEKELPNTSSNTASMMQEKQQGHVNYNEAAYIALKKSFLILQQQNEVLSTQLKAFMESISARDECETRMESLLRDFKDSLNSTTVGLSSPLKSEQEKAAVLTAPPTSTSKTSTKHLHREISDVYSQWMEIRRDLKRKLVSEIEMPLSSMKFLRCGGESRGPGTGTGVGSTESTARRYVRLSQVLGIPAGRLSVRNFDSSSNKSGDDNETGKFGLDMSSVHVLQRDLIDLNEHAIELLSAIPTTNESASPQGNSIVKYHASVTKLTILTSQLLLHLSSFAPVTKLSMHGSTSLTSLHCLWEEVTKLAGNRSIPQSVQVTFERCLAEKQACTRAYDLNRQCLQQWPEVYSRIAPFISKIGSKFGDIHEKYVNNIKTLEGNLGSIVLALDEAEKDRIDDPKRQTKINPLDALSRGVLGGCTGNLINALRMHGVYLKQVSAKLGDFRKKMQKEAKSEEFLWSGVYDSLTKGHDRTVLMASKAIEDELVNIKSSETGNLHDTTQMQSRPRSAASRNNIVSVAGDNRNRRRSTTDSARSVGAVVATPGAKSSVKPSWAN